MKKEYKIIYPRRTFIRRILKGLASLMANILMVIEVKGLENIPKKGPYIVVGNHVSSLEPLLMLIVTPHQLEFIGTGDIPIDPRMSFFTNLYRFIPIMRGQIDQEGLSKALEVLDQKGVLGIFPEGGIWDKNLKEPKIGTSWIAYKSKAPIIPIGFIGMNGALQKALTLKKPRVIINIGKVISQDVIFPINKPLKDTMQSGSKKIMEQIELLLPEHEIINPDHYEPKELYFFWGNESGKKTKIIIENQFELSKLLDHPVIMDVFNRNLKLPVKSLFHRNKNIPLKDTILGLSSILDYLTHNTGFLSYRFGIDESIKMTNGLKCLYQIIIENEYRNEYLIIQD